MVGRARGRPGRTEASPPPPGPLPPAASLSPAPLPHDLRRTARYAGLVALAIGALAIGGWAYGLPAPFELLPGPPRVLPTTALAMAMAGLSLWLHAAPLPARPRALATPLAVVLALAALLLGALAAGARLAGYDLPLERALLLGGGGPAPRPALNTSVAMLLLGAALLLVYLPAGWLIGAGQLLALAVAINGGRALVGYAGDPADSYLIGNRTGSTVPAAIGAIVLGVGALCARPGRGPMGLVSGSGPGGRVYRLLLAPAVILPLLVGALTLWGQRAGLFGVGVGAAAQALANLLAFWWLARALERSESAAERESERAVQALEVAERRMVRLQGLRDIDRAINSQPQHVGAILDVLLEAVRGQLGVDYAAVLLLHEGRNELIYTRSSGLGQLPAALPHDDPSYVGRAAASGRAVGDAEAPPPPHARPAGLLSGYAAPLQVKGQVTGVLEVGHRTPLAPDAEWVHYLETLAGQGAIALAQFRLFADLQRSNGALVQAYDATLAGWSHALELRDGETRGHTERVTALTVRLAEACGIRGEELQHIRRGALLHDIGKLGIPDRILLKPGRLTEEEWAIMRRHPTYAYQWLEPISYLRPALPIPYCHHERWDGQGYPRGLRGEAIPLPARLFAVVDVWDALRSERPYHPPWPAAEVKAHLRELAGSHFEPRVVELFLALIDDDDEELPPHARAVGS